MVTSNGGGVIRVMGGCRQFDRLNLLERELQVERSSERGEERLGVENMETGFVLLRKG